MLLARPGHHHLSLGLLQEPPNGFHNFNLHPATIHSQNSSPSDPLENLGYVTLPLKALQRLSILL